MFNRVAGVAGFSTSKHIFIQPILHKPLIFTAIYNLLQVFTAFYIHKKFRGKGQKMMTESRTLAAAGQAQSR
jgi:hypothetical protein